MTRSPSNRARLRAPLCSAAFAACVAALAFFSPGASAVTPVFVTDGGTSGAIVTYSPAGALPDLGELSLLESPANPFATAAFEPYAFAVHPTGRWGYASSRTTPELRTFDVAQNGELSDETVLAAEAGAGIAVTPDGRNVYMAGIDGDVLGYAVDESSGALAAHEPVPVGTNLEGIAVDPNGSAVFVSSPADEKIYKLSIGAGGQLTPSGEESLPEGLEPGFLATHPSRGRPVLYAVADDSDECAEDDRIYSYDIATFGSELSAAAFDRTDTVEPRRPHEPGTPTCVPVGAPHVAGSADPNGIAITPDGKHVYVANTGRGNVAKFDVNPDGTLAGDPEGPVISSAPNGPYGLVVSPGGDSLYATSLGSSEIRQFTVGSGGTLTPKSPASTTTVPPLADPMLLAVRPDQPPVPRFSVIYPGGATTGQPGAPITFDASASSDPEGSPIIRYDWDFGDGTTASESDPITTHTYSTAGDFKVTLRVTDATGDSAEMVYTGQGALRSPGGVGTGTARIAAGPEPLAVILQTPTQIPRPVFGKSLNIEPVRGIVLVKVPGSNEFVPVDTLMNVPVASLIDVVAGEVRVTAQNGPNGNEQQGWFWGGVFRANQLRTVVVSSSGKTKRRRRNLTEVKLAGGSFRDCPPRSSREARKSDETSTQSGRRKRRRSRVRRLWGNGKGNFRSSGRHSSATVRGTRWLVEDRCDGTLTYVRSGVVEVRDLKRRRTVVLRRGQRLLVKGR